MAPFSSLNVRENGRNRSSLSPLFPKFLSSNRYSGRNNPASKPQRILSVYFTHLEVGDSIPSVELYEGAPDKKVNTSTLTKGKVVIFGVPGAFTPTCSNDHVPGFLKLVDDIKKKGVHDIICVATNDPFVMAAWGKSLDPSGKIRFLADPRAELVKVCKHVTPFSDCFDAIDQHWDHTGVEDSEFYAGAEGVAFPNALDLTIDLTAVLGNIRSKRFALVLEDGKVKGINVEPDGTGLTCSRGSDILRLL